MNTMLNDALKCNSCSGFSDDERNELKSIAQLYLDANNAFMKLVNWAGNAAESVIDQLPDEWRDKLQDASEAALRAAYDAAQATQAAATPDSWFSGVTAWAQGEAWHRYAAAVTGALGGAGGLATTLVDLPVTTTLILRSIQQIAQGYGEDLTEPAVRNQCLSVFALGGPLPDDDDQETGLFAARLAVTGASLAALLKTAAPRFGVVVTEKFLAQAAPLLGAVAGGTINPVFTHYYQTMAHVHFRLRRIEKLHDAQQVGACFERIFRALKPAKRVPVPA